MDSSFSGSILISNGAVSISNQSALGGGEVNSGWSRVTQFFVIIIMCPFYVMDGSAVLCVCVCVYLFPPPLSSGWSDGSDWADEEVPGGPWYGHRDPGGHGVTPGTPGSAMVGGPMGFNDARGLTPTTPRSMMEPNSGNSWGSFSHKNKVGNWCRVKEIGEE